MQMGVNNVWSLATANAESRAQKQGVQVKFMPGKTSVQLVVPRYAQPTVCGDAGNVSSQMIRGKGDAMSELLQGSNLAVNPDVTTTICEKRSGGDVQNMHDDERLKAEEIISLFGKWFSR